MKKEEKAARPYGFWNWGTGIAITIIVSASLMIFLVYKSMGVHFDLSEDDYYAMEMRHEEKMIAATNALSLSDSIAINETEDYLVIRFPKECINADIKGTLVLYRPSEGRRDVNLPFTPDMNGLITVDKNKLTRGRYELKADWEMNQISYNVEKPFFVKF